MPHAKSKHIDLAKRLREEKPVPFGLYSLTRLAENIRGILEDDAYIEIAQALHLFGVRKVDFSDFPKRELRNVLDERMGEREYVPDVQGESTSRMSGR